MKTSLRMGVWVVGVLGLLVSCEPKRLTYTPALKEQMADMKIKRVTTADMLAEVDSLGGRIAAVLQKDLAEKLQQTPDTAQRTRYCRELDLPRARAIANQYGVGIWLLGAADVQNPNLSQKERDILDAYLYNAEQHKPQSANIQVINDTLFVYNAAVPAENIICQTCFRNAQTPLAVWRLAFSRAELVRRMKESKKK